MAGRGQVEPKDTVSHKRVFTINKSGELILAKEPLHFYEPTMAGLDCGLSFGKTLIKQVPDSISILLIPTAVGGSSISQWIGDSTHRNVSLLSNFKEKVAIGKRYGQIKGILWHQGESDANPNNMMLYQNRLAQLMSDFRQITNNEKLPILIGELGSYSKNERWLIINEQINSYVLSDPYSSIIKTKDFKHKGDQVHFGSKGQRLMGKRFANEMIKFLN